MTDRITDQQLAEIDARANAATPGPWRQSEDYNDIHSADGDHLASYWHTTDGEFIEAAREDVPALLTEVRRLRTRVTELEAPAVHARAALAALCYDLEDPGSNALGALYLLSQATVGVDAPKDDAAFALGQHAAQVLHRVADMADPEPPEVSFFGGMVGPAVAAWLRMLADRKTTVAALAEGAQR